MDKQGFAKLQARAQHIANFRREEVVLYMNPKTHKWSYAPAGWAKDIMRKCLYSIINPEPKQPKQPKAPEGATA